MSSGECYRLQAWEQPTSEKESGLLPTPKANDGTHPGIKSWKEGQTLHLSAAVMLPTPTARDWRDGSANQLNNQRSPNLNDTAAFLATPTRRNANNDWGKATKGGRNLCNDVECSPQRSLNPNFVEAMMGFPQNWTDVYCSNQDLQLGSVLPQSPASLGSLVQRLNRLRQIAKENIANSGQNTKLSDDNTKND
jgi:hypothetical protein